VPIRFVVVAIVIVALLGCSTHRSGLTFHLDRATGVPATDCGTFRLGMFERHGLTSSQAAKAAECVARARSRREPFKVVLEGPGIDSHLATGLLAGRDGAVRLFTYDSAPCGGPRCHERVSLGACSADRSDTAGQMCALVP
jgi:hypothetical protein